LILYLGTFMTNLEELQYVDLVRRILDKGSYEDGRNGRVKAVFGNMMRFSLNDGKIPILTTKKVAWRTCFQELMWFVRGQTDNRVLQAQNVHIWDGNASREFLDGRGLATYQEGDLGPIYGFQWRHWNAPYVDCDTDYSGQGIDQLQYVIDQLKNPETRSNRRLVISAWNPQQLDQMALPPCHILMQFNVHDGIYLSCALYQRSGDVGLGVPFNIASYSFLTHLIAHHCGLVADEFVYFLGNAHIYENHIDALKEQITRAPLPFPTIQFRGDYGHVTEYTPEDVYWRTPYCSHPTIKMDMVP